MINTTQRSYAAGYCDPSTPPHSPKTTAYQACPKPRPNLRLHHAFGTLVSGSSLGLLGCVLAAATLFAQPQGKPSAAGANPPPKSEGTDEDNSLAAARTALKRGDYDEAIKRASEALRAHPEDEAAKRLLERAQQAKRDDKRDHDRALELAREAMRSGDYGKAIEFLTLVVNGWPADADAKELL